MDLKKEDWKFIVEQAERLVKEAQTNLLIQENTLKYAKQELQKWGGEGEKDSKQGKGKGPDSV